MTRRDWENGPAIARLASPSTAQATGARDRHGVKVTGDSFLVLFNAHHEQPRSTSAPAAPLRPTLPDGRAGPRLRPRPSSRAWTGYKARGHRYLSSRSITVLRRVGSSGPEAHPPHRALVARPIGCNAARDLDLAGVRELMPYIRRARVLAPLLSPSFQAGAGSTHGNTSSTQARSGATTSAGRRACGPWPRPRTSMAWGIVLDVVPNHMGIDETNRWWADPDLARALLRHQPRDSGRYRRFFDIDDLAAVRHGGSRGLGRRASARPRGSIAEGVDRRAAGRPPRRPDRSRRLPPRLRAGRAPR